MADREQCTQCGTPLETGALAGLCPACLLRQGAAADTASAGPGPAFAAPAVAELAPLFPQLEIQALVGKGGMGAVYKARQPALDRWVALKLLPARAEGGAAAAERFSREARALARLTHPHIVGIYEYGTVAGYHYFLMELVDGVNLRQLQKNGRLSAREALQIVPQICDALQYAHDEGIVHRDIKPENVLLDRRGRVKIADFGLAKLQDAPPAELRLTAEGQVMGTPHYMAPEQVEHPHEVDHRADIFSLGVVFYELLTGELPLGKFPPPSRRVAVDVRLDQVVLRTLEKQPELRYQRAGEVRTAVETIASDTGKTTPARRPRLSALAVIGAAWAPFFFLTLTALYGWSADRGFDEIALSFLSLQPKFEIGVVLNWLSLLAPFGVTILGWLAISQIRRSQGCLYGLPLALVDGLLFPLLALDAIICGWWPPASTIQRTLVNSDAPSPTFLGMKALTDPTILASPESNDVPSPTIWGVKVLAAVALDALLYWLAWRALARPVFATPKTQTPVIPTNPSRRHFAPLSLGLFLLGSLGTLFLMAVSVHHDMALFFGVLALVLALVFGALSWQERLGKWVARITMAVLVGSLFSLAWLSGLIPYPGRAARKAELGAQALAAVAQQQVETQKAENARRQAARPAETRGISPPDFIQAETDLAALEVFGDRLETALQSGNRALAEKLMEQFVEQLLLLKRSVANTEVEFPTNRLVLTLKARDAIKAGDLAMAGTLFEAAMATTASDDDYPERIAALAGKQREARGMPFVLGPVIECELHSVWSGANCVLNVETGQTLPLPHAILETIPSQIVQQRALWAVLPRNKSGELWQWLISVNADLLCGEGPNNLFWLRGFVLGQTLDPSKPTKVLTAIEKFRLEARDYLAAAATNDIYNDAQLSVPLPPDAGDNYWVLFKTRKNRYGIIQVVEPLKNPPGVKIRYRLVQEAPAGQGEAKVNTAGKAPALAYQWFRTNAAVAPVNQVAPAESAQLKLKLAELDLTGMEKKYQAGFVTQYDRDVARFLRDIAAAELRQDPLETARLHLQLLDLHLKVAEAKQKVGLTNLAECERLRAIRDAAAAELQRMETNR